MAYKTASWGGCGRHLSPGMSSKVATDGPFEAVLGKTHRTEFPTRQCTFSRAWFGTTMDVSFGWGMLVVKQQRRRVPRGVSGTFEVSPTGSIPRRENPAWQVANDKVEASRAMLTHGQEAPKDIRPLTRGTVEDSRKTNRRGNQNPPTKSSRAVRAPPEVARWVDPELFEDLRKSGPRGSGLLLSRRS